MDEEVRRERLQAMGISVWRSRVGAQSLATTVVSGPEALEGGADLANDLAADETCVPDDEGPAPINQQEGWVLAVDLAQLRTQVSGCTQCELHQSRKQTVFGVGNESARLLIIGEAPGADEDAQGEPFVGRAGQLMNAMLAAIGLAREQVYIANILKCRPPGNRDPHAEEVASCAHFLQQQIAFVAPELILAVGRIAAQNLLGVSTPIGKMRGKLHTHPASGTPVLVTYHPAYLLRSPLEKRRAWQDLKRVAAHLEPTS
ncbi:MAG: uracil-DNA glycosylase family 4 [Gammaproteobacteria bacterium]|jgi:uracil-DNA glycosylase family 4